MTATRTETPIFAYSSQRVNSLAAAVVDLRTQTDNGRDVRLGKELAAQLPFAYGELLTTGRCNLKCPACNMKGPRDQDYEYLAPLIRDAARLNRLSDEPMHMNMTGGEATLHPRIWELIALARQESPNARINLSTNGIMDAELAIKLAHSGLTTVGVSLQGTVWTPEGTKNVTPKQHAAILNTIDTLVNSPTQVYLNHIISAETLERLPQTLQWAIDRGVTDVQFIILKGGFGGPGITLTPEQIVRLKTVIEPEMVRMIEKVQQTQPWRFNLAHSNHANGGIYYLKPGQSDNEHYDMQYPCYIIAQEMMLAYQNGQDPGGLPWHCSYIFRDHERDGRRGTTAIVGKPIQSVGELRMSDKFWETIMAPIAVGAIPAATSMCRKSCSPQAQRMNAMVHAKVVEKMNE